MKTTRSSGIDALRGASIIAVVGYHYWSGLSPLFPNSALLPVFAPGWMGVLLFFGISGYLLGGQLMDHRGEPGAFSVFYARRIARIVPLYLTLLCLVVTLAPEAGKWPFFVMGQNYYYAVHGQPAIHVSDPAFWLGPTWSLAVEEQFYLILPWVIVFTPRRYLGHLLLACIAASLVLREEILSAGYSMFAYASLPTNLGSLMAGVLLAWGARLRGRKLPDFPASPLGWVGRRSYALYLFHLPAAAIATTIFGTGLTAAIAALAVLVILAQAAYAVIEAPFLRYAHERFRYHGSAHQPDGSGILPVARAPS